MDAVNEAICEMLPDAYTFRIPSHEPLSRRSYDFLGKSELCFIGGTNILGSPAWRLQWYDAFFLKNAICLGVSWAVSCNKPKLRDRLLLPRVLSGKGLHSVRDGYTKNLLAQLGIQSVSTSCPTMWKLTPEHCAVIPSTKARDVVFTLTAYRANPVFDRAMIEILRRNYRRLYFFSQMSDDRRYIKQFDDHGVRVISPRLSAYDQFLANEDVDYVGSRLHGGIRALQCKKRTVVMAVDHRSAEIGCDTGLPVLPRGEVNRLDEWVNGCASTQIRLPMADIAGWKSQFSGNLTTLCSANAIADMI
jgi:hypothetical protein